jgi:hypothetical protein
MESHVFIVGLIVGLLATLTTDVVTVIAVRLGIGGRGPRRTGPDLIGRWIGYLLQGKFRHTDVLQTPPLRGELLLGFIAHYSIGIALTLGYLGLLIVAHATPTALSAILYGTAREWAGWDWMRRVMLISLAQACSITSSSAWDSPVDCSDQANLAKTNELQSLKFLKLVATPKSRLRRN